MLSKVNGCKIKDKEKIVLRKLILMKDRRKSNASLVKILFQDFFT